MRARTWWLIGVDKGVRWVLKTSARTKEEANEEGRRRFDGNWFAMELKTSNRGIATPYLKAEWAKRYDTGISEAGERVRHVPDESPAYTPY